MARTYQKSQHWNVVATMVCNLQYQFHYDTPIVNILIAKLFGWLKVIFLKTEKKRMSCISPPYGR